MASQGAPQGIRVDSPGKLNLFLEVLNKREDGFHEIETLLVAISIYDTVYFTSSSQRQLTVTCRWASGMEAIQAISAGFSSQLGRSLPQDRENIAWRAVDCFRRAAGIDRGAKIQIVKRIPAAAGLGGASSDAAAVLLAANHAWQAGWTPQRLAPLAAKLGSDIGFFISGGSDGGRMAVCRGRGERIEPIAFGGQLHFVIVKPPAGLSTAAVYSGCQSARSPHSSHALIASLQCGRIAAAGRQLFNRLEESAGRLTPWIARLRSLFNRLDCLGHQMSGSGTCYFGICRTRRHARRICGLIRTLDVGMAFHATPVSPACRIITPPL